LNGFSPLQLVAVGLVAAAILAVLLFRYIVGKPATEEVILGRYEIVLIKTGDVIRGIMSTAERIWQDIAFINSLNNLIPEKQFKTLRDNIHLYAIRDEATRAARDKTLLLSTASLAPETPGVRAIRSERILGTYANRYFAEGWGERIGTVGEWNIAYIYPRNLHSLRDEPLSQVKVSFDELKNLGELASHARRGALNISALREKDQLIEDISNRAKDMAADLRRAFDQRDLAWKGASRPDLRQYPPPPEPARRGLGPIWMYAVALIGGYFVGSNFFAQNFASAQQAGFVGAIVAVVALYFIQRRKLI